MASFINKSNFLTFITKFSSQINNFQLQPVRNNWADWRMIRDVKRRRCVKKFAIERLRINSLRKNDILPIEVRELSDKQIQTLPRDSAYVRTHGRCQLTSRPRGLVHKWRLSRIVWRHFADYNQMSGVQRAMW